MENLDPKTVASFGDEWSKFDQSGMSSDEARKAFLEYFAIFPWDLLPADAEGFDMGCGSGRWALFVSRRVGRLHCIDPSAAIEIARKNLANCDNVVFHHGSVDAPGLTPGSQDFGYSLGVLHHVPDTEAAIRACVNLLKPGAPLLLYLYYAFDGRPWWFKSLWKVSDVMRRAICRLPSGPKRAVTDAIAIGIYWPFSRLAGLLERAGLPVSAIPLSYYRDHSIYTLRTDSRDRFGTPLEKRFTRSEIERMMCAAGLGQVHFSDSPPYWCAVGVRRTKL